MFRLLTAFFLMFFVVANDARAEKKIGRTREKVTIFVTSWCPYCKNLESFLQEQGVPYTRYDIERDRKGALMHQNLGGGGVPVTQIGSTVLRGFNVDNLTSVLMEQRRQ